MTLNGGRKEPSVQPEVPKWNEVVTGAIDQIVGNYFDEKIESMLRILEDLANKVSTNTEDIDFSPLRYGAIEFNEDEVAFMNKYLDLKNKKFTFTVDKGDIITIMTKIGEKFRSVSLGDESMSNIAQGGYVDTAIRKYFLQKQFISQNDKTLAFNKDATPFLALLRENILLGLEQLFRDTIGATLLQLKVIAQEIDVSLREKLTRGEAVEAYDSPLERSFREGDERVMVIDPTGNNDYFTLKLLSAPIVEIAGNGQFVPVTLDKNTRYDDIEGFTVYARDRGKSVIAYFYGEPPFEKTEGLTHWANLILPTGSLKDGLITDKDIEAVLNKLFESFKTDDNFGLYLEEAYGREPGPGIPQFARFRIMTEEEVLHAQREKAIQEKKEEIRDRCQHFLGRGWLADRAADLTILVREKCGNLLPK